MSDTPQDAPVTSRATRRKEKTRHKIITVAVDLFRQHGFEAITMEQIANVADIAKGTLYNYFSSKEAIISAYVQQSFDDRHTDRIALFRKLPDTRARLTVILTELMKRVQAQPDVFEIYLAYRVRQVVSLRPDLSEGGKRAFGSLAGEIIRLGQEEGTLRADLPPEMLVELFEFVFVEVAKQFYLQPENFEAGTVVGQVVSLYLEGAGARR